MCVGWKLREGIGRGIGDRDRERERDSGLHTTFSSLCPSTVMLSASSKPAAMLRSRANSSVFGRMRVKSPNAIIVIQYHHQLMANISHAIQKKKRGGGGLSHLANLPPST